MNLYILIFSQITAHLLADFVFQSQEWSQKKEDKTISWTHVWHAGIVFSCSWLLSFQFSFYLTALFISATHLVTDGVKSMVRVKSGKDIFFIDQTIHIVFIFFFVWLYSLNQEIVFPFQIDLRTAAVITAYILCLKPSNILIKYILNSFNISITDKQNNDGLPNAGKLIGITERILALSLVLYGQFAAIGFIIAAKSILRFKENKPELTEYVLVGTLLSFSIAIISGILTRFI